MRVVQVPVIPIPNFFVLSELRQSIRLRESELRNIQASEVDGEYLKVVEQRRQALAFLEAHILRIQEQTAPVIDIIVDDTKPEDTSSQAEQQPPAA